MSVNIRVQDLDLLPVPRADNRRLEVVADGLPLFHGAQLAVDTTMVSTVRADGAPRRQCAERDGAALDQARRTKERTYPELTGERKGQTRGACVRDRRKMVRGVPLVPQAVGPSEGPVGAP